jgi:hypothetical protein
VERHWEKKPKTACLFVIQLVHSTTIFGSVKGVHYLADGILDIETAIEVTTEELITTYAVYRCAVGSGRLGDLSVWLIFTEVSCALSLSSETFLGLQKLIVLWNESNWFAGKII